VPVVLDLKVKDDRLGFLVGPDLAWFEESLFAKLLVLFEHIRETATELEGNAFAHCSDAVDRVDCGFRSNVDSESGLKWTPNPEQSGQ